MRGLSVPAAMPATLTLDAATVDALDLRGLEALLPLTASPFPLAAHEQSLSFAFELPRDPQDPREWSELPELRLWFLRADSRYPWLPLLLDWKAGELARYAAMLVPHQFHPVEGIQFNPEALELWMMQKIFVCADWLRAQGLDGTARLRAMAQMLGYELEEAFFSQLG